MSLESRGQDPEAEKWGGESRHCSGFSGYIRSEFGVKTQCLGDVSGCAQPFRRRSGEREEGVIHKLRPGVLGSVSRVEKAGKLVLSWTAGRVVAVTGPVKEAQTLPPADVFPQRDLKGGC